MTHMTEITADTTVHVRRARWSDKHALLEMIHALARFNGDEPELDMSSLIDLMRADLPWLRILVAERDGEIVGYAGLVGGVRLQGGQKTMDLHHLFIKEDQRSQGVGRALIKAAKAEAQAAGCHRLTVGTHVNNTAAQATYLACGFTAQTRRSKRFELAL